MRPIVHIGYHKTATTWFQRSVYPAALSHRWIARRSAQAAFLDPSGMAFDPEKARALLDDRADDRPLVICEENLSGYIHNGGLHGFLPPAVAHRIKAVLPDAQIVIFVRSQVQMIAACYTQYVRGGGTHPPYRYLFPQAYLTGAYAQPFKVPRFSFDHFDYDRLVALYDDLFGRENVHVYPYEALRDPQAVLDRLESDLGLSLDRGRVAFDRPNASWSGALLPLARVLNRFTARTVEDKEVVLGVPGFYVLRGGLMSALNRVNRRKGDPVLAPSLVRWIEQRYAAANARLREMRPGLLPDGFHAASDAPVPPPPELPAVPRALRARLLVRWSLIAAAALLMALGLWRLVQLL